VITTPEERADATQSDSDAPTDDQPPRLKAPVFHPKPVRVFEGHTGSILDLSWSKVRNLQETITVFGNKLTES
jgi:hypothetical protein